MKPVIFGCAGPALSDEERRFFADTQPAGFILFSRNIVSPQQLLTLTTDLKLCVDRSDLLIAVDQEGGRVQRMKPPHWRDFPAMKLFGDCARRDKSLAERALEATCRLIADDLRCVGINMNCAPVLDLPIKGSDEIIGDRAFSDNLDVVHALGQVVLDSFQASAVLPVIKHMPGHGRALVDSHKALPRVTDPYDVLAKSDFRPFHQLRHCAFAMTAHIVFDAVDPDHPATLSPTLIKQVIRQEIGFDGLLMTDDLSMQALKGSFSSRATTALEAGCDLVLHCNGDMHEMAEIAAAVPVASADMRHRIEDLLRSVKISDVPDRKKLEADFERYMAEVSELVKE